MLLANLGDQRLWQDEAQTALVAGTILTHGVPLGHDGRNSFSQEGGKDYGPGFLWLWHPWLPFYVLAGFFAVLGKSTFVARLPFALFGIATVLLAFQLAGSLWRSRRAGLLAAILLLLNVPFLILARQCRYHAPDMFFALLGLFGYHRLLQRRRGAAVLFAFAAIALFHTHYVHCAALLAAVVLHGLLFHRDRIRPVLLAAGATLVVDLPWLVWFSAMAHVVRSYGDRADRALTFGWRYLLMFQQYVFPLLLVAVAAAAWALARYAPARRAPAAPPCRDGVLLLSLFIVANLAAISLTGTYPFFRFLAPVIPAACLLGGLILDRAMASHRVAGPALALGSLLALGHLWSVPRYLDEITHHFVGPVDGIVEYLERHARPGDVVATTYDDLPIKFYTGLRVVGGLTGEDLAPAKTAEWVIIRRDVVSDKSVAVYEYLFDNVPWRQYRRVELNAPDTPFQNREGPESHSFRTASAPPVVILQRPPDLVP